MMTYRWNEEEHQKFLRTKHPNYYEMDIEEHKRKFEEAKQRAVREVVERELFRSRMTTQAEPVTKQDTIDVECEVISSTPLTQDDERTGLLPQEG